MPYVKSISIHTTVNRSIAYILNPDKTEDLLYTASLNCMTNAKDAYLSMKMVYENYSHQKYNAPLPSDGKGSVKAIHYIQSFDPEDNITPEEAHRIAKAFARKTFGDDCQVVIATHIDREHLHNHFIVNSYSMTGRKFYANQNTLKRVREYSDRTCLAFGIQPYDKNKGKAKTIAYNEWKHKERGTSWKEKIRLEIDVLIATVKNIDELLCELELKGYVVKRGKYISIKSPEQERFVRTKTLGEDYTAESLVSRILWRDVGAAVSFDDNQPAPIRDDYIRRIDEVSQLAKDCKKVKRLRDHSAPYSPQNDMDVYKLSAQLSIINRDRIHSIGELEGKIEKLKDEYEKARVEVNILTSKQEHLNDILEQAELFFSLSDKSTLSGSEQLKLNISRQVMKNNNICDCSDYEQLKAVQRETDKKITALKDNFKDCKHLYEVYADIAKTYYDISKGDYISRLIEEERKRRVDVQHKTKNSI